MDTSDSITPRDVPAPAVAAPARLTIAEEVKLAFEHKNAPKPDETLAAYYHRLIESKRDRIIACIKHIIAKYTPDDIQAIFIPLKDLEWPDNLISRKCDNHTPFENYAMQYFKDHEGVSAGFAYHVFGNNTDKAVWLQVVFNGTKQNQTPIVSFSDLDK